MAPVQDLKVLLATSEQLEIIESVRQGKSAKVYAGPGCGKTATINLCIKALAESGIPAKQLVSITYNKRLADASSAKRKGMSIKLFHDGTTDSLCHKLVKLVDCHQKLTHKTCIKAAIEVIERGHDLGLALKKKGVKFIFVDESQDLTHDTAKVLNHIIENSKCNFMLVGDPRQAIYETSDAGLMTSLFHGAVTHHLTVSHRLNKSSVDYLNAAFKYEGLKPLQSATDDLMQLKPRKHVISARDMSDKKVINYVVEVVQELMLMNGSCPSDIAILSPVIHTPAGSRLCEQLRTALKNKHIDTWRMSNDDEVEIDETRLYLGSTQSFKGSERRHIIALNAFHGSGAYGLNSVMKNLTFVLQSRHFGTLDLIQNCFHSNSHPLHQYSDLENVISTRLIGSPRMLRGYKDDTVYPPPVAITEMIQKCDAQGSGILEETVAEYEIAEGINSSGYEIPRVIKENNDRRTYGIFLETVIAHHMSVGRPSASLVRERILKQKVYVSDKLYQKLRQEGPFALPANKLKLLNTSSYNRLMDSWKGKHNGMWTHVFDKLMEACQIVQLRDAFEVQRYVDEILDSLHDDIADVTRPTNDVILSIWKSVLLQSYSDTRLGIYMLQDLRMTPNDILPSGASSWAAYLEDCKKILSPLNLSTWQAPLERTPEDDQLQFFGSADFLTESNMIVEIKSYSSDKYAMKTENIAQVQAYRHMLRQQDEIGYIFSALKCQLYKILPTENDKMIFESLSTARKRVFARAYGHITFVDN